MVLAKEPIYILNLLTKEGGQRIIYTLVVLYTVLVLPSLLPGESLAFKLFLPSDMSFLYLSLIVAFFYLATMVPRVDPSIWKAIEVVAATRAAERKKKRLAVQSS